jgi:hypothetical protein
MSRFGTVTFLMAFCVLEKDHRKPESLRQSHGRDGHGPVEPLRVSPSLSDDGRPLPGPGPAPPISQIGSSYFAHSVRLGSPSPPDSEPGRLPGRGSESLRVVT